MKKITSDDDTIYDEIDENTPFNIVKEEKAITKDRRLSMNLIDDQESDLQFVRQKYRELIANGMEAIETLMELAKESDSPRAHEVLANSIKSTSEVVEKIVDLHLKDKKLKESNDFENEATRKNFITQNNVFIGSTAELQKAIREQQKQCKIIEETGEIVNP